MKHLNTYLLASFFLSLVITSCSIEKRVHMSGYHTKWHKSNQTKGFDNQLNEDIETTIASSTNDLEVKPDNKVMDESGVSSKLEKILVKNSKDSKSLSINSDKAYKESRSAGSNNKHVSFMEVVKEDKYDKFSQISSFSEIFNKTLVKSKSSTKMLQANDSNNGNVALRAIGWVLLGLGAFILWFISILIGGILMLLGLIFVISGANKGGSNSKTETKSNNSQYIDVVYLKNGSIIRGIIIEQTPNVSLKIQTKDGSVFVYNIEDVEKMTKELENR